MNGRARDEPLSAAEERLVRYLLLLRADAGGADAPATDAVMRTVRWQYAARHVVAALGSLAAAVADGVDLVLGRRRRRT